MKSTKVPSLSRRAALSGGGGLVIGGLAAPALAQSTTRVRVSFGSENPAFEAIGRRLEERVRIASGGSVRLSVGSVFGDSRPFSAIGKATDGLMDLSSNWVDVDPAFGLFSSTPFGLTAREFEAWVLQESGKFAWDGLGEAHGVKCLLVGDLNARAAYWSKEPIRSVGDFAGKRVRSRGLGIMGYAALGATAFDAEADGIHRISDISDSYGFASDMEAGMPSGFSQLYTPSAMSPHNALTLAIDLAIWNAMPEAARAVIESCCIAEADVLTAESITREMQAFRAVQNSGVQIQELDQKLFNAMATPVIEAIEADMNARSKWVDAWYDYRFFLEDVSSWTAIGDSAFALARARAMGIDT